MLVVFLAGVMPKEYIHDMIHHHHDDVHPLYKKGELVITVKHNHCSFLSFEFAPFVPAEKPSFSFRQVVEHTSYIIPARYYHYASPFRTLSLRGPPILHKPA